MHGLIFRDIYDFSDFVLNTVKVSGLDLNIICKFEIANALISNLSQDDNTSFASIDLENEFIGGYAQEYLVCLDSNLNIRVQKTYLDNKLYSRQRDLDPEIPTLLHKSCNCNAVNSINEDYLFIFSLSDIDDE
ncbi:hypothetical protein [Enterocloster citroniae]|uniref:hypothetical protein n=1 Tax=Enterocloster citroniae TaxID=358743 RepID=UPI00058C38B2|nr:hypothetical protein [Enterocloster citroniae]MCC3383283.1 hypothetical protein [Enterocloster citroniae]DAT42514.1 MAG TPA: hypothetical protein [Caudoviricetes sp.]